MNCHVALLHSSSTKRRKFGMNGRELTVGMMKTREREKKKGSSMCVREFSKQTNNGERKKKQQQQEVFLVSRFAFVNKLERVQSIFDHSLDK